MFYLQFLPKDWKSYHYCQSGNCVNEMFIAFVEVTNFLGLHCQFNVKYLKTFLGSLALGGLNEDQKVSKLREARN